MKTGFSGPDHPVKERPWGIRSLHAMKTNIANSLEMKQKDLDKAAKQLIGVIHVQIIHYHRRPQRLLTFADHCLQLLIQPLDTGIFFPLLASHLSSLSLDLL